MYCGVCKRIGENVYLILQRLAHLKAFRFLENLPHGRVVLDAYRLLFEDDVYLAFGLSVTMLERALFELHYEALQSDKVSSMALQRFIAIVQTFW